jgi:hypothetical protein
MPTPRPLPQLRADVRTAFIELVFWCENRPPTQEDLDIARTVLGLIAGENSPADRRDDSQVELALKAFADACSPPSDRSPQVFDDVNERVLRTAIDGVASLRRDATNGVAELPPYAALSQDTITGLLWCSMRAGIEVTFSHDKTTVVLRPQRTAKR